MYLMYRRIALLGLGALLCLGLCNCSLDDESAEDRNKQRERELRENMRRVQVAAEHYAADHGTDNYPKAIDDEFKTYFPGGSEGSVPAPFGTINVFSGANQFPSIKVVSDLHSLRHGPRIPLAPGEICYCPLDNGKAYAIIGGGSDGKALEDDKNPGEVLVFTNLED